MCPKCNQSYQSSLSHRTRGRECPNKECRREKQVESIKKALIERRGSLLKHNPDLAREWHPIKNGELTPDNISPASDVKVWWLGPCKHEWEATPSNRVRRNSGCPVCNNKVILIGFNDLATTHKGLCAEWDYEKNGEILPTNVVAGTHKRYGGYVRKDIVIKHLLVTDQREMEQVAQIAMLKESLLITKRLYFSI